MDAIRSYEEYVNDITKMFHYRFTGANSEFDEKSLVKFIIHDYYLNNPVKAFVDLLHKLDMSKEDLDEL